jgi:predicted metal-dependent phosphoesterase TrpH
MKLAYDLHIHSALSPCGDNDMTPNNIVNMSCLKGLDIIAVTDHNSAENLEAVMKCSHGKKLIVIPGIEIMTREEVHIVCLFPTLEAALQIQ